MRDIFAKYAMNMKIVFLASSSVFDLGLVTHTVNYTV